MNDILLPTIKELFNLTYTQASGVQQSFYLVYLIFPIPIAYFISRYGYKSALVAALLICSMASLLFVPAYHQRSFAFVMAALFTLSIGVTLVNVAANPLAALLGTAKGAHVRVNIVQLFSRVGFSTTPLIATRLMLADGGTGHFYIPYLAIGGCTLLLGILLALSAINVHRPRVESRLNPVAIIRESIPYSQLRFGILAMFFYMGAEAGTAGFFISYLQEVTDTSGTSPSTYLTYYYLASTVVSFIGIFLIGRFSPGKVLACFASCLAVMYVAAVLNAGALGAFYLLAMGAFISILFPLIFSLSIERLGEFTEKGSALINMAIVGGAVFPPIQGLLADSGGIQLSYIVPCACTLPIILFGMYCSRKSKTARL